MKYEIVDGNKLCIVIDISKEALAAAPMSKSGKNKLVASTNGFTNIALPGGKVVGLSLNCTTK
jgi:hypothetical protein